MIGFTITSILIGTALAGVQPEVNVSGPWTAKLSQDGQWTFSHPQHRATLTLRTEHSIGLNLSYQNRTLHTQTSNGTIPLFAPPFDHEQTTAIRVENQGIDLVIKFEGPTLREWTQDDTAPADQPVLSWVRVRVRGEEIRFVLTGVHRWTLPASTEGPYPTPDPTGGVSFNHGFGRWRYTSTADGRVGSKQRESWTIDSSPSIELKDPYPTTTIDWSPSLGNPRP